jgi:hypothetical protein
VSSGFLDRYCRRIHGDMVNVVSETLPHVVQGLHENTRKHI